MLGNSSSAQEERRGCLTSEQASPVRSVRSPDSRMAMLCARGQFAVLSDMQPRHILGLILLWMAILGGMSAYLEAHRIREPTWSVVSTSIACSLLVFWWYWTDSALRSYRRSPLLNVAVVAFGFVAVPYYLLRSRPRGQRLKAMVCLLGFFVLLVAALFIGALPVALLS